MAIELRFRIVYLDECVVTKQTVPTHVWSLPKHNAAIDIAMSYTKPHAILAAVSREYGLDLIHVYKNSVNICKFKTFLQDLRDKYPFD